MKKIVNVCMLIAFIGFSFFAIGRSIDNDPHINLIINSNNFYFNYGNVIISLNKNEGLVVNIDGKFFKITPTFFNQNEGIFKLKDYLGNYQEVYFFIDNNGNVNYNSNDIGDFVEEFWYSLNDKDRKAYTMAINVLQPIINNMNNNKTKSTSACIGAAIITISNFANCAIELDPLDCVKGIGGLLIEWEVCQ